MTENDPSASHPGESRNPVLTKDQAGCADNLPKTWDSALRTVVLSSIHDWPWNRQLSALYPLRSRFLLNGYSDSECAPGNTWFVAWDEPREGLIPHHIPRQRRILWITEPPAYKRYAPWFTQPFGIIISPYALHVEHSCLQIPSPPLINWFYGVDLSDLRGGNHIPVDVLASMSPPQKTKRISIVTSNIKTLDAHCDRLFFTLTCKRFFKDSLDLYGRGFIPIADKSRALNDYMFSICLENNFEQNFWTEKVADAFLGWCVPIYSGCPNLERYFSSGSFIRIDYRDPGPSIRVICEVLNNAQDLYADRMAVLAESRRRVVRQYNVLRCIDRLLDQLETAGHTEWNAEYLSNMMLHPRHP